MRVSSKGLLGAPSPLMGEGWGEGGKLLKSITPLPSPLPQGERGSLFLHEK